MNPSVMCKSASTKTLVHKCLGPAGSLSRKHLLVDFARTVGMHGMVIQDGFPDDFLQLLGSRLAMQAGCDHDRDRTWRDAAGLQGTDHVR